jgi:DNA invertase Pin-like site-specific DNA recombinase
MTIRVYARCSSDDQNVKSQRQELERWVRVHEPQSSTVWYEDEGFSGGNGNRPAYQRLMKDVKAGDTVLCFSVDRMTREGIVATLQLRQNLKAKGAKLLSVSEPWLSDDNPASEIVTAVLAWAAEHERKRIHARQRAGIEARRDKTTGRCPWGGRKAGTRIKVTEEKEALVLKLHRDMTPVASIARMTSLTRKTIYAILTRHTTTAS